VFRLVADLLGGGRAVIPTALETLPTEPEAVPTPEKPEKIEEPV
jgi:hypothetical protein